QAVLRPEEYSSRLVAADPEYTAPLAGGAGLAVLDATLTPELEAEGWAKDRIRELQELRKTAGLDVSDRISVVMSVPEQRAEWAAAHRDLIAGEILATSFEFGDPTDGAEIGDGVRVSLPRSRIARCACGQTGMPATTVPPAAMIPIAASTLSRPSLAQ